MAAVDIQLASTHTDWPTLRKASLQAERAGFDAIWVHDHLGGVAMGGGHSLECFTWLGALAEATSRIELGVMVANTWNRQVGTLAVAAASVSTVSDRRFLFGVGAGTSPRSQWAAEQHAVGTRLESDLDARHARVEELLDLTDQMWHPERSEQFASFTLPNPVPPRIVGVNSTKLSKLAGRRAEGVNVAWDHPRRGELMTAATTAAAGRPFVTTTWIHWSPDLLDPGHPTRTEMDAAGVDRVIFVVIDDVEGFAADL